MNNQQKTRKTYNECPFNICMPFESRWGQIQNASSSLLVLREMKLWHLSMEACIEWWPDTVWSKHLNSTMSPGLKSTCPELHVCRVHSSDIFRISIVSHFINEQSGRFTWFRGPACLILICQCTDLYCVGSVLQSIIIIYTTDHSICVSVISASGWPRFLEFQPKTVDKWVYHSGFHS